MLFLWSMLPLAAAHCRTQQQTVLSPPQHTTFVDRTQVRRDGKDPQCRTGIRSLVVTLNPPKAVSLRSMRWTRRLAKAEDKAEKLEAISSKKLTQRLTNKLANAKSVSTQSTAPESQVCCPMFCKECGDYPTCKEVFGPGTKNSEEKCCASKVLGAVTTQSCDISLPPCKLSVVDFAEPEEPTAAADCGAARDDMDTALEAAAPSDDTTE